MRRAGRSHRSLQIVCDFGVWFSSAPALYFETVGSWDLASCAASSLDPSERAKKPGQSSRLHNAQGCKGKESAKGVEVTSLQRDTCPQNLMRLKDTIDGSTTTRFPGFSIYTVASLSCGSCGTPCQHG